jgi:hypothetical protein
MANDGAQLCYLLVIIVAIGFLVWGFMDLLKKQQPNEKTTTDVISRQVRGFAFIMLSQVILLLGGAICFGLSGGVDQLGNMIGEMGLGGSNSVYKSPVRNYGY